MQYRLSTLLLVVTLAAFAIYFCLPTPALRIETIHSATPSDEIQPLAYTISVQDRKFDSNHPTSFDPDDLYGNHFSDVLVTRDPSGKIWRELIVNIGSNDKRDIRVRAVLLDSIPQFEEFSEIRQRLLGEQNGCTDTDYVFDGPIELFVSQGGMRYDEDPESTIESGEPWEILERI